MERLTPSPDIIDWRLQNAVADVVQAHYVCSVASNCRLSGVGAGDVHRNVSALFGSPWSLLRDPAGYQPTPHHRQQCTPRIEEERLDNCRRPDGECTFR